MIAMYSILILYLFLACGIIYFTIESEFEYVSLLLFIQTAVLLSLLAYYVFVS